jgi:hypothetical protein
MRAVSIDAASRADGSVQIRFASSFRTFFILSRTHFCIGFGCIAGRRGAAIRRGRAVQASLRAAVARRLKQLGDTPNPPASLALGDASWRAVSVLGLRFCFAPFVFSPGLGLPMLHALPSQVLPAANPWRIRRQPGAMRHLER